MHEELLQRIRRTNDYERKISGAMRFAFNAHMDKWRNDVLPDKLNNNFFAPISPITEEDVRAAIELQKKENHTGLMFRMKQPMDAQLVQKFGFEEEVTHIMALVNDRSAEWVHNPDIVIKDIQCEDISRDMLDVSTTPPEYRAAAYRSMSRMLKTARTHPEYHWLIAYREGKAVGGCYALCKYGCIEMDDLEVRQEHRGQHIATTLMKHIAQSFDGTMYLHADSSKSVHDMYARMGFETVGIDYDYYLDW